MCRLLFLNKGVNMPVMNYNKPSKILALESIYRLTGSLLREDKVVFGIPKVLDTRADIEVDHNTYCDLVVAKDYDNRFQGETGFLYRREKLENVLTTKTFINVIPYPFKTSDILRDINIQYDLQLTLDDVIEKDYTDSSEPFRIEVSPHSLFWYSDKSLISAEHIDYTLVRLLEDGSVRYTENALPRYIDSM